MQKTSQEELTIEKVLKRKGDKFYVKWKGYDRCFNGWIDKKIFAKGYTPNWLEEVFVISKIKNTVPWTYVINDLNGEDIIGSFYEKELQKTNQKELRIEKLLKRKGDKFYVKWKGYNN